MKKRLFPLILGAVFAAGAAYCVCGLAGHRWLGMTLLGCAAAIWLFAFLPKGGRIALAVLLILGLALFAWGEAPVVAGAHTTAGEDTRHLIVLGAGLNGSVPSLSLYYRLNAALAFLEAHPGADAVLSGGQGDGEDMTEAQAMQRWLVARGVTPERLLLEETSTSTEENLRNSFALLRERGGDMDRIAVLSADYHLYRARTLAGEMGVPVSVVSAPTEMFTLRLNYFIREGFASVYMRLLSKT